jgi:hypothetical protein
MRINFATKNCSAKLILHALNDYPEYQMIPWKMSVRSQFTHCSLPYGTWRSGLSCHCCCGLHQTLTKIPESPLSLMLVKIVPLALPLLQAPSSHPTTNFQQNKILKASIEGWSCFPPQTFTRFWNWGKKNLAQASRIPTAIKPKRHKLQQVTIFSPRFIILNPIASCLQCQVLIIYLHRPLLILVFASVASNIQSSNSLKSLTITHLLKPFSLMTACDNNSKHNKTVMGIARDLERSTECWKLPQC